MPGGPTKSLVWPALCQFIKSQARSERVNKGFSHCVSSLWEPAITQDYMEVMHTEHC